MGFGNPYRAYTEKGFKGGKLEYKNRGGKLICNCWAVIIDMKGGPGIRVKVWEKKRGEFSKERITRERKKLVGKKRPHL